MESIDIPEEIGGLGSLLPAEVLKNLDKLLERLNQVGKGKLGSININIYKPGSQHVDKVENQYIGYPAPSPVPTRGGEKEDKAPRAFDTNTPLSALFRESSHEELKERVTSWRPRLKEEELAEDELAFTSFQFDFTKIRPVNIYMDLAHLINHDALCVPMSVLAAYMFRHSNLSKSEKALYVQLKRYRSMCK